MFEISANFAETVLLNVNRNKILVATVNEGMNSVSYYPAFDSNQLVTVAAN